MTAGSSPLAGTRACTGDTITFTPAENLPWNRVITVTITATVTDTAGNAFAGTSWSFTTCEEPDTTKLSVLSTNPADNETGTISQPLVNQNIIISFDDDLDPASVSNASVVLITTLSRVSAATEIARLKNIRLYAAPLEREKILHIILAGGQPD